MTQDHQAHVRESMRKKHDAKKNVVVFSEGDFATLAVTGNDRTSLDSRRLLVKIIEVPSYNVYKLQCKYGVLERKVTVSSLNIVPETIARRYQDEFLDVPTKTLNLHQAAALDSNIKLVTISCNCRKGCRNNRRICHKNNNKCSQYCHTDEYDCGNLAERIIDRTEKSIIDVNDVDEVHEEADAIDVNSESDRDPANTEPTTSTHRKRAATLSSPKQRKHKQPKTTLPSASSTG